MSQKKFAIYLFVFWMMQLSTVVWAQMPVMEWTRLLGTTGHDVGGDVSIDESGNVYVTGNTSGSLGGSNEGFADMFLAKYDADGAKLWTRQFGTADGDNSRGLAVDVNGDVYVTGYSGGDGSPVDMFLIKFDADGAELWSRQLGSTNSGVCYGVSADSEGNVYITGSAYGALDGNTSAGGCDIFLMKYDMDGSRQWTRQWGTTYYEYGDGVSVDTNGNVYVTGSTRGQFDSSASAGNADMFLTKYDTDGVMQWTSQLHRNVYDFSSNVSVDGDGNAYVTGVTSDGDRDIYLAKYDTDGIMQWITQLGTVDSDSSRDLSIDESGNVFVTGITNGDLDGNSNTGGCDLFLTKYYMDGTKRWTWQLGTVYDDGGIGVSVDGVGNAYITGYTCGDLNDNDNAGGSDMFLVKISNVPELSSVSMLIGFVLAALVQRRRW